MSKSLYKILSHRSWATIPVSERKNLFQMLIIWALAFLFTGSLLTVHLISGNPEICILCDVVVTGISLLGIICTLNGKTNCSLNAIFSMPVIVYAYYISDFNLHPPVAETIAPSLIWLTAGLVFLFYFSSSEFKIWSYFVVGLITVGFHLFKAGTLVDSLVLTDLFTNPLILFTALFLGLFFIRKKYATISLKLQGVIQKTNQSINRIFQESGNAIAQVKVDRDEEGNAIQYRIEKVNNAFESEFKINLYEVQDQKADFIFNLIFKGRFNFSEILKLKPNATKEYHAKKLDKWYHISILKPDLSRYYIVLEDITKAKKKLNELEAGKRRYKVLLEAIPDIFFVIDKDGTYEDFVIKESDLFKIEDANIIGSTIYDVGFPDNMADLIFKLIQKCIKTNSIESIEYSLNTPNGTFLFEMRLAKLNNHSVISVARDITKRKTAEFDLEKALVKAEESDRLKSAFLANLSHEIKTPMNIITNLTQMLAETEMSPEERRELTEDITQNGKQLLNMIDNTIHLSKIETNTIELSMGFSSVNQILRDIYNQYFTLIPDSKSVKLYIDISVPNQEFGFVTDAALLRDSLTILVDNAVKYTMSGEIRFGYEMVQNKSVKFTVSDTGIGIPKEEHEHIFDRFYRVQHNINESTSGSGLGLPIVQHYIELLGGELEFESVPDQGTKFWFSLPFKEGKGFMTIVKD